MEREEHIYILFSQLFINATNKYFVCDSAWVKVLSIAQCIPKKQGLVVAVHSDSQNFTAFHNRNNCAFVAGGAFTRPKG